MGAQSDQALGRRIETLVSGLDATLSVGGTIRAEVVRRPLDMALPVISIDGGEQIATAARSPERTAADLQLLGLLGSGGMGAVYAAQQRTLERDVAVKRPLTPDATPEVRAALLGEARTMGALEHPNIVPVHALGCDAAGQPLFVMKRIEGVSWRDLLRDAHHPMWERLGSAKGRGLGFHVEILMQVSNALHFAHSRGVVHRDVKPENVMIGAFGEVYLLDWGIARTIGDGAPAAIVGTPTHMAPEMLLAPGSADERTDVYLLGATLHELLVGRPLHQGASLAEVFHAILSGERVSYGDTVPGDLAALASAATSPERAERPPSCAAFRDALSAYVAHRASRELAASASSKLEDVEARLRARPADLASVEIGVLLAESRFGFEQSLREWRENDVAERGLVRSLGHAIDRELGQRNAVAARALVSALPSPDRLIEARVAELEKDLEAARVREAAQAERARELDASVSAWPRALGLGAFLVVVATFSTLAYLEEQRTGEQMSMAEQLSLDAVILAALVGVFTFGRRRLLTNAYNRAVWSLWLVMIVGVMASDAFLASRGADAATATAVAFGWTGAIFAGAAVTFNRGLGWVALTGGGVGVISALFPSIASLAATIGSVLAIAIQIEQSRRSAAQRRPERDA